MIGLVLLLFACGSGGSMKSEPTEPVVELGGDKPQSDLTWETLKGLLPEGEPGFPAVLAGLRLGLPEAEARKILEAARHPQLLVPEDQTLDELSVTSAHLNKPYEAVGVTLIFKGGEVFEVDLSLPPEEAIFAATQAWGKPDEQLVGNANIPEPAWVHEGLQARMITTDGPAVLKFSRVE